MLEQLAREIRAGGILETGELAARLGTTPQLIEAMLDHLQRSGLIQAYVSCTMLGFAQLSVQGLTSHSDTWITGEHGSTAQLWAFFANLPWLT